MSSLSFSIENYLPQNKIRHAINWNNGALLSKIHRFKEFLEL